MADQVNNLVGTLLGKLLTKLNGRDGKVWLEALGRFLKRENPWDKPRPFATIARGRIQTKKECLRLLEEAHVRVTVAAKTLINQVMFTTLVQSVELVVRTATDLGLRSGASYDQICKIAIENGLQLCHPEDAISLRLLLLEQRRPKVLVLASTTLNYTGTDYWVFAVIKGQEGLVLGAVQVNTRAALADNTAFVFVQPSHDWHDDMPDE